MSSLGFDRRRNTDRQAVRRNRDDYYRVGPHDAPISNFDRPKQLCSGPDHDIVSDSRPATTSTSIPQCHIMIKGAPLSHYDFRVNHDAAEMMDAKSFSYLRLDRNGNTCGYFNETLNDKSHRLSRYPTFPAPSKDAIHNDCLKALRQDSAYYSTNATLLLRESGYISLQTFPQLGFHFEYREIFRQLECPMNIVLKMLFRYIFKDWMHCIKLHTIFFGLGLPRNRPLLCRQNRFCQKLALHGA